MADEPVEALEGQVWVCPACGRRAKNRDLGGIDGGWDSSCRTHAVLCLEASVKVENGIVVCAEAVHDPLAQIMP